jgi:hypothetical protein
MKLVLFFFNSIILAACLGVMDESKWKPVTEEPRIAEIVGSWNADDFSYKLINEKKIYKNDSVSLILKEDHSFTAINFPDLLGEDFQIPVKGKLINATGKWNLVKVKDKWQISLDFDPGELFPKGIGGYYPLFRKDSKLIIWMFVGDPDQGNRLAFIKK